MKPQVVYVLTSTEQDYYLEQAIISMHSLKIHNPNVDITLVSDAETADSLNNNRAIVKHYISDYLIIDVPKQYYGIGKSRYIKTTLRRHIKGDYVFIDTDTVITDNIMDLFALKFDIGAVADTHVPLKSHTSRLKITKLLKSLECNITNNYTYLNSGVIFARDSDVSHTLYETWHNIWKQGIYHHAIYIDQPSLAKANELNGYPIIILNGEYNCQITENGLQFLNNARIIHYYASNASKRWDSPYRFRDKHIYDIVKNEGITESIDSMIRNAKSAFNPKCTIIAGNQTDIYGTPLAGIARRLSIKYSLSITY